MTLVAQSPAAADGVAPVVGADTASANDWLDDGPRTIVRVRPSDVVEFIGSLTGSFCLALLLLGRFGPFDGVLGLLILWLASFIAIYGLVVREGHGTLMARDRLSTVIVATAGLLTVLPLGFVITYVIVKGISAARHLNFYTETLSKTGGDDPLTQGGIAHAIVGSAQQVGIALAICVGLAIGTAVYLNEIQGRWTRPVRFFVNTMSGTPSIVAGLFIYASIVLRFGFSGFAAGVALSILMLPTITRTAEEVLRLVPGGLREAALALGAPEWRVALRVVLPTARSGIITAVILGVARVVGEAAPVLLTAFGANGMVTNPFNENQDSLPLRVFQLIRQPNGNQVDRAWGAALVLIVLVLVLFVLARVVGARRPGTKTFRLPRRASTQGTNKETAAS